MYVPTFASLVGDEEQFFTEHFGRSPLLRRGALTGPPAELLSLADLDECLHEEALRTQYLRLVKRGDLIHEGTYTQPLRVQRKYIPDRVVPERVYEHFRTGASVVWHSMNHFRPNLRALNAMLAQRFATRSDSLAFLTPAGQQGFVIHHDPNDTFVIHLHGKKRWRVWPTARVTRPDGRSYKVGEEYRAEHLGEPLLDVILEPGDVMYLPNGTPHVAAAEDTVSLHLTVTVTPRTWPELLRSTVAETLQVDAEHRGFPHLTEETRDEQAAVLKDQIEFLVDRLRAIDPRAEVARLTAEGRAAEGTAAGHRFAAAAAVDETDATTAVRAARADFSFTPSADGDRVGVRFGGKTVAMPRSVADALRSRAAGTVVPAGQFVPTVAPEDSVRAVKTLARLGAVALAP
ncbi:cupin domain-containing protein [Streptomyces sp. NPDC059176]|uniref:cupin domain-containing protein n=1 Tax=unclassified Streptomyces TaxID=2593676 RepID=UPI003686375D